MNVSKNQNLTTRDQLMYLVAVLLLLRKGNHRPASFGVSALLWARAAIYRGAKAYSGPARSSTDERPPVLTNRAGTSTGTTQQKARLSSASLALHRITLSKYSFCPLSPARARLPAVRAKSNRLGAPTFLNGAPHELNKPADEPVNTPTDKPLAGLKVVELGTLNRWPLRRPAFCAEFGADVIKVESPDA